MSVNRYDAETDTLTQVAGDAINNIDDSGISDSSTWSSQKISDELVDYGNAKVRELLTGGDLNTIVTEGIYSIGHLNKFTNAPNTNDEHGILRVTKSANGMVCQEWLSRYVGTMSYRVQISSGDWESWHKLATMSALDSKQNFTKIDERTKTIEELFNEQDDITCTYQSRFNDGVGNDFGFVIIQKTNSKYGNITFHSNNGVYQNRITNGTWSGWLRLATTDDIISETKTPVGQVTINANATYSNTAVNVEKSGYKVLMTTVSTTGHNTVYCYNSSYEDGKMTIQLRNNSSSNITVTPYVTVVYKKA